MDEPVYRIDAVSERRHLAVFCLLAAVAMGLAVHAKRDSNPSQFTTDRLTAVSATRT